MKVELVRGVVWEGKAHEPGEVLDVTEVEGFTLVDKGKARLHKDPEPKKVDRSVGLMESTTKALTKRTREKKSS